MVHKSIRKMADECGLVLIQKVGDPGYNAVHVYTQPKDGVEWSTAAGELSKRIFHELKIVNKVYKGKKHPDLYNFTAIDEL